jgi:DNA modification methylase
MKSQVICGNNIEVLKGFPDDYFDSIVTDPPYGIDFLGKSWDANTGALETYQQCLRVLKPGGHIIAFSAARTYHHLAVTIEQAGFEIRDQIMWIYGSGFPKSQDIGRQIQKKLGVKETKTIKQKNTTSQDSLYSHGSRTDEPMREEVQITDDAALEWLGWGTALKPAHEPCVLARKPISEKNIADNCIKWGVGALNIDATRVGYASDEVINTEPRKAGIGAKKYAKGDDFVGDTSTEELDANQFYASASPIGRFPANILGEISEPYQKYFYCPKVSRKERHIGHEDPGPLFGDVEAGQSSDLSDRRREVVNAKIGNHHPTVKPIELMKYLIKLVTKPGGRVLDPFNGSGSTGCAAVELDYEYVGIDLDPHYVAISERRIAAHYAATHQPVDVLFKEEE